MLGYGKDHKLTSSSWFTSMSSGTAPTWSFVSENRLRVPAGRYAARTDSTALR
jgi:hypothetical protein